MTRSLEAVEKGANKIRKTYIVISPDGVEHTINGLAKFCRENGLHCSTMARVANGKRSHHKGWKCKSV